MRNRPGGLRWARTLAVLVSVTSGVLVGWAGVAAPVGAGRAIGGHHEAGWALGIAVAIAVVAIVEAALGLILLVRRRRKGAGVAGYW